MTLGEKLDAMASRAGASVYHRFMALLGAHPKTTVILAFVFGFVAGTFIIRSL